MPKLPTPNSLSLKQKIGQLFMPAAFINDSEDEIRQLEQLIANYHIGSLCFFHSRASAATNFEGKKEVIYNENSYERLCYLIVRYQKAARIPLLITIDAEWGLDMRIENTPQYPYAITLGAIQENKELIYELGKSIAHDCHEAGIHWNLSPVVDINLNPENPVIGYRSFGGDKEKVSRYAKAYLRGMASVGILNAIKHFPGHGDTATDSHLGLPLIAKSKETLLDNELYPFLQLMDDHLDAIMVGHLSVPALTAGKKIATSISKELLTHFLRDELNYEGLIISDALNMHAVSKDFTEKGALEFAAFEAGNDVLCFSDHPMEGISLIEENGCKEQIEASFKRIWALKEKIFEQTEKRIAPRRTYRALMAELATESLTLIKGDLEDFEVFIKEGFQFNQVGKEDGYFRSQLMAIDSPKKNKLLSIVPKQVKPKNNFGFSVEELKTMRNLLSENDTIIYLFGNPFVLNLLPWNLAKAIVVVYQDFEEFQKNAAKHFFGKTDAKGKLPVKLKKPEHAV